nr:unnamed protein product [Callosobruchus analis]
MFVHIFQAVKIQSAQIIIISADADVFALAAYFWKYLNSANGQAALNTAFSHITRKRVNLIQKLGNSSRGASAETLRISRMALVYPTAEHCGPEGLNSKHTHLTDTQLQATRLTDTETNRTESTIREMSSKLPSPNS